MSAAFKYIKRIHGGPAPKDLPADMQDTPPLPFPFKVGDEVTYTNGNGLSAKARIRGFAKEPRSYGGFVYLEHWSGTGWRLGAWWFPELPESISALRLTAYRIHRSDGSSYVTSMAGGVTLLDAREYFLGATQYLDEAETQKVTVTDVTVAEESSSC